MLFMQFQVHQMMSTMSMVYTRLILIRAALLKVINIMAQWNMRRRA
ncbi:unnamed protein product [Brassica oleracea var. botrytis]